ncbi:MAG: hypothetical protein E7328_04365 [Clostridiales bacterium]|nr:hypothetical protein [Clostridiales bacterium]
MKRRRIKRKRQRVGGAHRGILCAILAAGLLVFRGLVPGSSDGAMGLLAMGFPLVYGYTPVEDQNWDYVPEETKETFTPNIQPGDSPRIMIYSSHSNEAYTGDYTPSGSYRTLDKQQNIMRVSGELATVLSQTYGMPVYYEETDHELGKYYNTAYNRSLENMQKRKKEYPSLEVFIDIHRDAYSAEQTDVAIIDGKEVARVMIVVGTGEGQTGSGFKEKPNWKENKKFADALFARLEQNAPGIGRKVLVQSGRYNQHVSNMCIAIEVGYTGNSLQHALNAVPYLAKSLYEVLSAS